MRRGLCFSIIGLSVLGALGSLAGCGRSSLYMQDREEWRHEAEVQCLKSGAVKESAALVRVSPIDGPGMCGADFPLKVAALGESSVLGFADDLRPPGSIPKVGNSQPRWPVSQPSAPPADIYAPAPIYREPVPPAYPPPRTSDAYEPPPNSGNYLRVPEARGSQAYQPPPSAGYQRAPAPAPRRAVSSVAPGIAPGEPMSLTPPGISDLIETDTMRSYPPDRPDASVVRSYPPDRPAYPAYPAPRSRPADRPAYSPPPPYPAEQPAASAPETLPALGPARGPQVTGAIRPVELKPNATLACPIVSALDQWIAGSVQPAAMRWFGQPVAEIKQISAYSCRGMNGQAGARISEHAFGNALDISAFTLADGRKIVVRTAWNGAPAEQGFLRDIQGGACKQFNTVLAPGSNQFHYDHIHVDLMRRSSRRQICQPAAMPGEVAAARAAQRSKYAGRGDPSTTGSIGPRHKLADTPYEDDDHQYLEIDTPVKAAPVKVERRRDE